MNQASADDARHAPPRLVVPAYFRSDVRPAEWALLAQHPQRVRLVILNLANGPGDYLDPAFGPALDQLRSAGIAVVGYVDTNYGQRPAYAALEDLGKFLRWYDVAGVCFDRVSVSAADLPRYADLARSARQAGAEVVVFNHGAHPLEGYADHADVLGTFEGPWRAYLELAIPRWTRSRPPEAFYHVVHTVPADRFADAFLLAAGRRAGCVYITDYGGSNPYQALPASAAGPALPASAAGPALAWLGALGTPCAGG
ncbi:MAG: spherulation-specific family 4 protein [Streptosporangiaceae bacterium]